MLFLLLWKGRNQKEAVSHTLKKPCEFKKKKVVRVLKHKKPHTKRQERKNETKSEGVKVRCQKNKQQ